MANESKNVAQRGDNEVKSLYNFMTQMNANPVRTQNLFEMRVFVPVEMNAAGIYRGLDGNSLTRYLNPNFTYYGTGFELPARTLQYADVGFKGFTVPVPTVMRMDQEHTVTINSDINGDMRRAFLGWQALTMNPQIDAAGGYFEGARRLENSGKLFITLLDPVYGTPNQAIETYTIYGVTIESVGTMTLSNTESGIATFQVKFRSQYWQYGLEGNERKWGVKIKEPKGVKLEYTDIN
jgi:hypothetical protein